MVRGEGDMIIFSRGERARRLGVGDAFLGLQGAWPPASCTAVEACMSPEARREGMRLLHREKVGTWRSYRRRQHLAPSTGWQSSYMRGLHGSEVAML